MAQMDFIDLLDRYASLDAKRDPLIEMDAVVAWEEFRPALEAVWRKPEAERKSRAGRKPIDAVLMFKTLLMNRLVDGLGIAADPEMIEMAGEMLHRHGYKGIAQAMPKKPRHR